MDVDQPGLFDLADNERPNSEPPAAPARLPRGRSRETWAQTTTVHIDITDSAALFRAATSAYENAFTIELPDRPEIQDEQPVELDPRRPGDDVFDALAWLIWPNDGMAVLEEIGAFRILGVDIRAVATSIDQGSATWTVTVKLTDVGALRRLATVAQPELAGPIADSLEVAWRHAADPFAPVRSIPGITWQPGTVTARHLRKKQALERK